MTAGYAPVADSCLIGSVINLLDDISLNTRPDFPAGFAWWAEDVENFFPVRASLEAMQDVAGRAPVDSASTKRLVFRAGEKCGLG